MNTPEDTQARADACAAEAWADAQTQLTVERLVREAVEDGRKLVTVRTVDAIDDIPGADLIKVATVEGWKVVVKAGEFQPGDLCVFFEVDSFLNLADERFAFLEKNATTWHGVRGARLKTIRLRKQLSQGLALPLSLFPEVQEFMDEFHAERDAGRHTYDFEDIRQYNFTGMVGVMKYEKVMNAQLAGMAKGNFPSFLRKSDQERAQNMGREIFGYEDELHPFDAANIPEEAIIAMVDKGELVTVGDQVFKARKAQASRDTTYEITLKLDGSSMTVYRKGTDESVNGDLVEGVCSRNLDLKMEGNEDNSFVQMAQTGILAALGEAATDVALQGELMGPGIQGNREGFTSNRFFVYNVLDIQSGEFLTPKERRFFIHDINAIAKREDIPVQVEMVPLLVVNGRVCDNVTLAELGITNMDELLKFAEGPSINHAVREGLVFKANDGRHQFKVISNLYLEKEKE